MVHISAACALLLVRNQDIADVVCRRAELGRNFGTVLIPDALLMHLPNMKILLAELRRIIREAQAKGEMRKAQVICWRNVYATIACI